MKQFIRLFACLVFVPLENFLLVWRRHHYRGRATNFDLISVLMVIEQWGFFNVPHLLWHKPTLYNCHLRGPVTLTPVAERLAVELSLPVFNSSVCCGWDSNTQPSSFRTDALNDCANAAVVTSHNVYTNTMHKHIKIQPFDVEYLIYFQSETEKKLLKIHVLKTQYHIWN